MWRLKIVLELLRKLQNKGFVLDFVRYNIMMDGLYKGRHRKDKEIVVIYGAEDCVPSVVIFITLINGYLSIMRLQNWLNLLAKWHKKI